MTTYTAIPDASLEPGKPARSVDAILLRDNPIAITEGASGAPKIQAAALDTDSVLAAYGRDVTAGEIGSFVLGHISGGSGTYDYGSTIAGSSLHAACFGSVSTNTYPAATPSSSSFYMISKSTGLSGTWRCMGVATLNATTDNIISLWVRIA